MTKHSITSPEKYTGPLISFAVISIMIFIIKIMNTHLSKSHNILLVVFWNILIHIKNLFHNILYYILKLYNKSIFLFNYIKRNSK